MDPRERRPSVCDATARANAGGRQSDRRGCTNLFGSQMKDGPRNAALYLTPFLRRDDVASPGRARWVRLLGENAYVQQVVIQRAYAEAGRGGPLVLGDPHRRLPGNVRDRPTLAQ